MLDLILKSTALILFGTALVLIIALISLLNQQRSKPKFRRNSRPRLHWHRRVQGINSQNLLAFLAIFLIFISVAKSPVNVFSTAPVGYLTPYSLPWQEKPTPPPLEARHWFPQSNTLHPAVANMSPAVEVSIKSVAQYIAQQEPDPYLRVKALHDYVVDRVAYDASAYFSGRFPPQDAKTVFRTHKAVCSGYSDLLVALGRELDITMVTIIGEARSWNINLPRIGHAWTGVKIEDNWYLIDATWDSGYIGSSNQYVKQYSTNYLFIPPEILAITHLPENPDWQLLSSPLSKEDFLAQPVLHPSFFAQDLKLIDPTRSLTNTKEIARISVANPAQFWMMAKVNPKGESASKDCEVRAGLTTSIACPLDGSGTYEVNLFSSQQETGLYPQVGYLVFNNLS